MSSKLIVEKLYPLMEKGLTSKSNDFMRRVAKYIDNNNEVLFDIGPGKRLLFSDNEKEFLYNISGITPTMVEDTLKNVKSIDSSWNILNEPFNIINVLPIRYYMLKNKKKEMETAIIYATLSHYSSVQFKYFKYETNDNVMTYTINNLSNRFYIKQYGSLFKALHVTALNSHDKYKDRLKSGSDDDLIVYINSLRNRIDNMIYNIADQFYKNWESGNYFNTESDDYSEENYHVSDSTSYAIKRIADAATMQTIARGVDQKYAQMAAKMTGVSVNAIRTAVNDIVAKKNEEINILFTLILQLFLMEGKNTVRDLTTIKFITFCNDVYIKTNTKDDAIIKIKELLDEWLNECSANYRKTERAATLANYRKAIYFYCVFLLNNTAKA